MDLEYKTVQAIEFMEENLTSPIKSIDIALEIGVSVRQLYRIFQNHISDSLANYLRTRRLTEASIRCANSDTSLIDIALDYQFNSPENFCRAFSKLFWHTPSKFRKVGSDFHVTQRPALSGVEFPLIHIGFKAPPKRINTPQRTFIGIHHHLPNYGFRKNDEAERRLLFDQASYIANKRNENEWNIVYRTQNFAAVHVLDNWLAIEVDKVNNVPDGLSTLTLPESEYLVFRHQGSEKLLDFTISMALDWLVRSPYCLGDAPTLFNVTDRENFSGDLYIAVSNQFLPHLRWWSGYSQVLTQNIRGSKKSH